MQYVRAYPPSSTANMVKSARLLEKQGFDVMGIGDTQSGYRELYSTMSVAAHETDQIDLGPTVTNPVTRHPVVTASALCTINEHSNGRAIVGIGAGDSAVHTIGERPARVKTIEEVVPLIKALCRGETVEYNGETVQISWLEEEGKSFDIPVGMTAQGPKTLRTAGKVADFAIIGLGITPEVIDSAVEQVNEGARAAGRDPDDVDKWFVVDTNVRDDTNEAVEEIKMSLATFAHMSLQFTLEGKAVPDEYKDRIQKLVDGYDPHEHGKPEGSTNPELVDKYELQDYLNDRYAIAGTPEDCAEKIQRIKDSGKVAGIQFATHTGRDHEITKRLGEEVFPLVD